eukprot:TRINITY_DN4579_c0_g2_i1.p1 TRINITY_DN4579_c0_g2~~TRINITY_DN4579_c0_g2_i1.p1  ORF type:complete len:222 (-),score=125.58 TRINITY_DN4579_c0_g2_i1:134-799(-)
MGNTNKKVRSKTTDELQVTDAVTHFEDQTNINNVEAIKLDEAFRRIAVNGRVDRNAFLEGLGILEAAGLKEIKNSALGERLFQTLDINNDNMLDIKEFIGGLSLLCKGTPEEKLSISFRVYDLDGNGFITHNELAAMFKTAWLSGLRALAATPGCSETDPQELEAFANEMSEVFANDAFSKLDENKDGRLSEEEFKRFALADPKITATLNGFKRELSIVFS